MFTLGVNAEPYFEMDAGRFVTTEHRCMRIGGVVLKIIAAVQQHRRSVPECAARQRNGSGNTAWQVQYTGGVF